MGSVDFLRTLTLARQCMPCQLRYHATKLKKVFVTSWFTASYKACTDLPREQTTQEQPLSFQAVRQSQLGKKHFEVL